MDLFDSQYFKINKLALTVYGLWPYQSEIGRIINHVIFVVTSFSMIFAMAAGIQSQVNAELKNILETVVALVFCGAGLVKCTILYNQRNQIKKLYERIAADWEKLTDTSERDILRAFLLEGRHSIVITIVYAVPAFCLFICVEFLPRIFSKESAKHRLHSFPYYYKSMVISENTYDLQVCVHLMVVIIYVGFSYLCASATYISSVKHVCALYAIACQRLRNAIVYRKNSTPLKELIEDTSVIPNLIKVIEMHKEALRGIQIIEQVFSAGFFVFEISALTTIAILIFDLNYHQGNPFQMMRVLLILSVFVLYLFFMNWCGEQTIQSCNNVNAQAYNIEWYGISLKARVFVLMILRRTLKPIHLTAGTIMILSMENFGTILKTAWSFGMILLTTQTSARNKDPNFFGY
ncbi:odorant receptor 181 [Nasonia vitripennis]|uniref:Odorant receptor n=1 Tax=Nasonia vitripennis TaxID=7425 RepID=A0A7M6USH3_NASVI|nr:odorant receptor 181 [Nasonia vitripennis]